MLIEAAKGGHTLVVGLLLDYPRSIVMATPPANNLPPQQQQQQQQQLSLEVQEAAGLSPQAVAGVPPSSIKATATSLKLRKTQRPGTVGTNVKLPVPLEVGSKVPSSTAKAAALVASGSPVVNESTGYDFIEGSGFVIEGKKSI
jgi:hypothetical protein